MVIYSGSATVDDGDRKETVEVILHGSDRGAVVHPFDAHAGAPDTGPQKWHGRIVSNCDWDHWSGKFVTVTLPTGRSGFAVVEASGALTAAGDAPFDF